MSVCPSCGNAVGAGDVWCPHCGRQLATPSGAGQPAGTPLVVATFGPSTGWVGKTLTWADDTFTLEGFGVVTAAAVLDYDRSGHLQWAYAGLREWVGQMAGGEPAAVAPAQPSAAPAAVAPQAPAASAPEATPPLPVTDEGAAAAAPAPAPDGGDTAPGAPATADLAAAVAAALAATAAPATGAPAQPAAWEPPAVPAQTAAWVPPAVPTAMTPVAPTAVATQSPPSSPRRWVTPVITIAAFAVVFVLSLVLMGGRVRDALGVAFTVLAFASLVLLIIGLAKPSAAARLLPGLGKGALAGLAAGLCVVSFALAGVLWWMPHYEVVAPADRNVVLDDSPSMTVRVVNHGLLPGTFTGAYSVGGTGQSSVSAHLAGGQSKTVSLALPEDATRGDQQLELGGTVIAARAVLPPKYEVDAITTDVDVVKKGQPVTLQTTVTNSGDVAGTFPGALTANGNEETTQPVKVAPGASVPMTFTYSSTSPGKYELQVGDASTRVVVVKTLRLPNGYVLKRSLHGGPASLTIKNPNTDDAMVILTRGGSRPALAVYVRKMGKTRLTGIPDGTYSVWDCKGTDWNWYQKDFLTTVEHKRWRTPLKFHTTHTTNSWTTSWSDPRYIYTQRHTQTTNHWSNWTITLGSGTSKFTKLVSEGGFPQL